VFHSEKVPILRKVCWTKPIRGRAGDAVYLLHSAKGAYSTVPNFHGRRLPVAQLHFLLFNLKISRTSCSQPDPLGQQSTLTIQFWKRLKGKVPDHSSGENLTFGTLAARLKPAATLACLRYHPLRSDY